MTSEERKGHIKDRIRDLARDLLYYDRKEDEELSADDITGAIDGGDIDIEWMAAVFLAELKEYLED